ncbi:MAG: PorP/SprF family type IX secretion system membrane protein [Saprospiraceae bacterium]|nr:PorP/SprF family type IX secretion system membrane protein [Saprospiraceae bacterium]
MHTRKLLSLFACLFLTTASIWSQDIHFTQYNMAPMSLNPAQIGKFEGTVRIGGIFRGQWASVLGAGQQFRTPSVWVDAPIIRGFRKRDWVGIGLSVFTDKAGALGMTHNGLKLGAAYHLSLDKKGNTYLSVGYHFGGEQRKLSAGDRAQLEDGFKANGDYGASVEAFAKDAQNYSDNDAGIALTARLNKRMNFVLGFSMFHIGRPSFSLVDTTASMTTGSPTDEKLARRAVTSGTFNIQLNDKLTTSPSFLFQTMAGADEIAIQNMFGYLFNEEKDITLKFGLGYRLGDAAQVLLGYQKKDLQVGFAYDINVSQLSNQTNYRGGFEIAANYIIKKYKKADPKPKILCPRF